MSIFLTDPENPDRSNRRVAKKKPGYVDFKEATCATLQEFGIPLRPAETAVIDFRPQLMGYFNEKYTAAQAAVLMVDEVRRLYKV